MKQTNTFIVLRDKEGNYLAMVKMFDAELIKVHAEYTLTTLDGQEPFEPVKDSEDVKDSFKKLLDILTKD
ncbi:TPA: hypothetical protein TZ304_002196 [Streptococcus suis]|nr:hypothetical protein [Streptococcus suis]